MSLTIVETFLIIVGKALFVVETALFIVKMSLFVVGMSLTIVEAFLIIVRKALMIVGRALFVVGTFLFIVKMSLFVVGMSLMIVETFLFVVGKALMIVETSLTFVLVAFLGKMVGILPNQSRFFEQNDQLSPQIEPTFPSFLANPSGFSLAPQDRNVYKGDQNLCKCTGSLTDRMLNGSLAQQTQARQSCLRHLEIR
jgi:hypothetical protein